MIQASMYFEKSLPTGGSVIPVGINKGVMFMGLVKGEGFYDLTFQNKEGQTIHKRLFNPDGSRPKEGESPAEAIERQTGNNIKHVVHLLRVIYGDDAISKIEAPTYEDFMKKTITLTNPKKGFLVNLKVTLDRTNKYSDLGFFPSSYMEAFVEGQESQLRFSKKEQEALDSVAGVSKTDDAIAPNGGDLPF